MRDVWGTGFATLSALPLTWQERRKCQDTRIYLIDERGKIKTGFDFEGADDPSARAQADTIRGVAAAEIWERARLVARIGQESG